MESVWNSVPCLYTEKENEKAKIRSIMNCSTDFQNAKRCMTGIRQVFKEEIITVKPTRMRPSCT